MPLFHVDPSTPHDVVVRICLIPVFFESIMQRLERVNQYNVEV